MRFVWFLGLVALGFVLIIYNRWLVDHTTRIDFFEGGIWGSGGTYTFVKLFGVVLVLASFYVLVNGVPGQ